MAEDYKDVLRRHLVGFVDAYLNHLEKTLACESPIEHLFAATMFFYTTINGHEVGVTPQAQIGDYRVDFIVALVEKGDSASVIVECDGHDFHEKTKEQASRDKQRDRELQKMGHQVFRFTGSEIWADPFTCAEEVVLFLSDTIKKRQTGGKL